MTLREKLAAIANGQTATDRLRAAVRQKLAMNYGNIARTATTQGLMAGVPAAAQAIWGAWGHGKGQILHDVTAHGLAAAIPATALATASAFMSEKEKDRRIEEMQRSGQFNNLYRG